MFSFPGRGDLSGSDGTGHQKGPPARSVEIEDSSASSGRIDPARFRLMVDHADSEKPSFGSPGEAADLWGLPSVIANRTRLPGDEIAPSGSAESVLPSSAETESPPSVASDPETGTQPAFTAPLPPLPSLPAPEPVISDPNEEKEEPSGPLMSDHPDRYGAFGSEMGPVSHTSDVSDPVTIDRPVLATPLPSRSASEQVILGLFLESEAFSGPSSGVDKSISPLRTGDELTTPLLVRRRSESTVERIGSSYRQEVSRSLASPEHRYTEPPVGRLDGGVGLTARVDPIALPVTPIEAGSEAPVPRLSFGDPAEPTPVPRQSIERRAELLNPSGLAKKRPAVGPSFYEMRPDTRPTPRVSVEDIETSQPVPRRSAGLLEAMVDDATGPTSAKTTFADRATTDFRTTRALAEDIQPRLPRPFADPGVPLAEASVVRGQVTTSQALASGPMIAAGPLDPDFRVSVTATGRRDTSAPVSRQPVPAGNATSGSAARTSPADENSPTFGDKSNKIMHPRSSSRPALDWSAPDRAGVMSNRDKAVAEVILGRSPAIAEQRSAAPNTATFLPAAGREPDWSKMPVVSVDPVPPNALPPGSTNAGSASQGSGSLVSVTSAPGPPVSQQIGQALLGPTPSETIVRLEPEELGRVTLGLRGDERAMTLLINADRPETLELIRRNIQDLASELADLGYHDLSFEFGGSSNQDQAALQDRGENASNQTEDRRQDEAASQPATRQPGQGHVDIRL